MNKEDLGLSWLLTVCTGTVAMTVVDWIGLAITVLCGLASLGFTIWKWYKAAKADGKITKDEIKDLAEKVIDEVKDTTDDIDKIKKK